MKKPKQIGFRFEREPVWAPLGRQTLRFSPTSSGFLTGMEMCCNQLYKSIFLFLTVQYGTSSAILYYIRPGNVLAACMHDDNWPCIRWHLWQDWGHPDHIWELKHCKSEPCPSGIQVSCLSACLKRTDVLISRGAFIRLFSLSCNIVCHHLLDALNITISLQKADRLKIWLPISALPT